MVREGLREGNIPECSGKSHDQGKPAFRRLGILPQQFRTYLCLPLNRVSRTSPQRASEGRGGPDVPNLVMIQPSDRLAYVALSNPGPTKPPRSILIGNRAL